MDLAVCDRNASELEQQYAAGGVGVNSLQVTKQAVEAARIGGKGLDIELAKKDLLELFFAFV